MYQFNKVNLYLAPKFKVKPNSTKRDPRWGWGNTELERRVLLLVRDAVD